MSIYMRDLSPLAYGALENLSTARDWVDIQPYMEPEPVAWLVYRLEVEPDNEDYFPSGKWATIQRLQEMLRKEAALEHDIARHIQITAEQAQEMEKLRQDLDASRARNKECDLLLSRVLHELAGSASLCWEPKPTGVFATELALGFVEDAIKELRAVLAGEKK